MKEFVCRFNNLLSCTHTVGVCVFQTISSLIIESEISKSYFRKPPLSCHWGHPLKLIGCGYLVMVKVAVHLIGTVRPIEAHLRVEVSANRVVTVGIESADRGQRIRRDGLVILHGDNV